MQNTELAIGVAFAVGLVMGWLARGGQRSRLSDESTPRPIPANKISHAAATQDAQFLQLLRAGNKIEAIKRYRDLTGSGLKESKDATDALDVGRIH
jgi:ribosomal protein L7/L12